MRDAAATEEQAHRKQRGISFRSSALLLGAGVAVSAAVAVLNFIYGLYEWATVPAYAIIGYTVIFSGLVAEELWSSAFAKLFRTPFTVPAILSRVPFWMLAGGIGYTAALLVCKKAGLLGVYEIPVWYIFYLGTKIGGCTNFVLVIIKNRFHPSNKI
jgi:hypothetical protein